MLAFSQNALPLQWFIVSLGRMVFSSFIMGWEEPVLTQKRNGGPAARPSGSRVKAQFPKLNSVFILVV